MFPFFYLFLFSLLALSISDTFMCGSDLCCPKRYKEFDMFFKRELSGYCHKLIIIYAEFHASLLVCAAIVIWKVYNLSIYIPHVKNSANQLLNHTNARKLPLLQKSTYHGPLETGGSQVPLITTHSAQYSCWLAVCADGHEQILHTKISMG